MHKGTQTIMAGATFPNLDVCWQSAPPEQSPQFFPAFSAISIAVQKTLRERVPASYFENLEHFRDPKMAYPMLLYQASRPFRGNSRTEFTYDLLNPLLITNLVRGAKPKLMELVAQVEARLRAQGLDELADKYAARGIAESLKAIKKVYRGRRCLHGLIRGENVLVDALIQLNGLGTLAAKDRVRRMATLEKKWSWQLRRLYPGTDFTWLGPVLFDAATKALLVYLSASAGTNSGNVAGPGGGEIQPGAA